MKHIVSKIRYWSSNFNYNIPLEELITSLPQMNSVSFIQIGSVYCLNGYIMNREEISLWLSFLGYEVVKCSNFDFWWKVKLVIEELPPHEVINSLFWFNSLSVEDKNNYKAAVERPIFTIN
jgi:hypothetical protein